MQRAFKRAASGAMIVTLASTACSPPPDAPEIVALVPFAEIQAPLSDNHDVVLVSPETACVIESFEYRVICRTRDGVTVGAFGRKGEGPGELLSPRIVRQSHGRVAAWDVRLGRVSVFEPDGTAVSEFSVPGRFHVTGISPMGVYGAEGFGPGRDGPLIENQVRDAATGEVVWRRSIYEIADTECGDVGSGMPYREIAGTMSMPRSAMEPYAAAYREQPKKLFHVPRTFNADSQGRLWVATTRDRDTFSYFDIWVGTEYAGTVRIRGRLMGYDILDSTLVALVEREPDADGIAQRALDWYDIGEVPFGVGGRQVARGWY